jgi:hypothetical protein
VRPRAIDAIAVAIGSPFLLVAALRIVDPDEGWYSFAADRVSRGEVPYRNFFFPQMPLLPLAYAPWAAVTDGGLGAQRWLSALLAIGTVLLVARMAARSAGLGGAVAAALLTAGAGLDLLWYPTVKTYALSAFLLVAAVAAAGRRRGGWGFPAAGLLAGFAIDTRLLLAVAVPAFVVSAYRARPRKVGLFAVGLAVGLLPSLGLLALYPTQFVFQNLGYHAHRTSAGLVGDPAEKVHTLGNLVGLGAADHGAGAQFVLLAAAAAVLGGIGLRRTGTAPLALAVAVLVSLACLTPTPTYVQYFCIVIPLLAAGAVEAFGVIAPAAWARWAAAGTIAVFCALGLVSLRDTLAMKEEGASLADVSRVTDAIDSRVRPGERVLSSWPGYLAGSRADAVAGTGLGNFTLQEVDRLPASTVEREGLLRDADVRRLLAQHSVPLVVYRPWAASVQATRWIPILERSGYELVSRVSGALIYQVADTSG